MMPSRSVSILLVAALATTLAACASTTSGRAEFAGTAGLMRPSASAIDSGAESPSGPGGDSNGTASTPHPNEPNMCSVLRTLDLTAIFGRRPLLHADRWYACEIYYPNVMDLGLTVIHSANVSAATLLGKKPSRPMTVAGQPALYNANSGLYVSTAGNVHRDGVISVIVIRQPELLGKIDTLLRQLMPTYRS